MPNDIDEIIFLAYKISRIKRIQKIIWNFFIEIIPEMMFKMLLSNLLL